MNKQLSIIALGGILLLATLSCDRPNESLLQAEQLMNEHPDSALHLLEKVPTVNLSRQQYADWCLFTTQAWDKNRIIHSSDSLINKAMEYYEKQDNPSRLMLSYYYMGRVALDLNQFSKAQEYYLKALSVGESMQDYALLGRICSNLGMLYTYGGAKNRALPYLKKAETYFRENGDSTYLSLALRDIARAYDVLGHPDSSILSLQQ
ncbi:hypothetical protein FACS189411_01210 [Bacteroidia bacterium]|nr:hypothetical protein FACS189411_01210 [Bacteroidia bacterium]